MWNINEKFKNKVDMLHVRFTELHATHQNLPSAIRTLRVKETIQNIHQKTNEICQYDSYIGVVS